MDPRDLGTRLRERLVPSAAGWLLVSGVVLALAHPPFHLLFPSFVGLVPFLIWLGSLPDGEEGRREARRGGFFLGLVYYTLLLYWLAVALIWYTPLAILAFLAPVLILCAFLSLMTLGVHEARHRLGWPLWLAFPVFWTANEWLRGNLPDVAFPWMQLGDTLTGFPRLIGAADVVGSRGLSFWLALVNALVALCVLGWRETGPGDVEVGPDGRGGLRGGPEEERSRGGRRWGRAWLGRPGRGVLAPAVALGLVVAGPLGYSLHRWGSLEMRPAARVAVVQPNVPEDIKLHRELAANRAIRTTEALLGEKVWDWEGTLDLVVLPETVLPVFIDPIPSLGRAGRPDLEAWVGQVARRMGAPVLYGGNGVDDPGEGRYEYFNSAFFVLADGSRAGRYDKRHLVPVVERVPFVNPHWFLNLRYFGGFGVGRGLPVFEAEGASFGVLICYESIYPSLTRRYRRLGADYLVNITNDAWFGREQPWWSRSSALWQHPAHLVMRSVEARAGAARSANTGISFLVDPLGRVHHATELFTAVAFAGDVMTTDERTLYVRYGDVVGLASALVALAAILLLVWRTRREASTRSQP